jgi:hypothetical protein
MTGLLRRKKALLKKPMSVFKLILTLIFKLFSIYIMNSATSNNKRECDNKEADVVKPPSYINRF